MRDTFHQRFKTVEERFWEKVDKTPGHGPQGDCWLWTAGRMHHVDPRFCYGQFWLDNTNRLAHRVAYELVNNKNLESSVFLCHRCDNPPCVRPSHLFEGDALINARDCREKGRHPNVKGESMPWSKLTEEDVRAIRGLRQMGFKQAEIASRFGVSRATVGLILKRINWKHVS